MKKIILFILILVSFYSCEIDTDYNCYTFEITREITYTPYKPGYRRVYRYERCGISDYTAYVEARDSEYYITYYQNGYYVDETQTCVYWRKY